MGLQGVENSPALNVGSVFCTQDRALLGRVEDVFGPVTNPMYAVRYCGTSALPTDLAAAAQVYAVAGRCQPLDYTTAAVPARDWDVAVEGDDDSDDDEDEAAAGGRVRKAVGAAGAEVKVKVPRHANAGDSSKSGPAYAWEAAKGRARETGRGGHRAQTSADRCAPLTCGCRKSVRTLRERFPHQGDV